MIKILNKTRIVRIVSFQTSLRRFLDPRHYTSRPSFQMSDVASRMSDVGCRMLDVGCRMSDVGCRISDVGCRMSDLGCRISDVRCRISDVGFRMSNVGWHFRLQNSPYFCVFKYARAVKQKVLNKAENREREWGETLKIRTVRFACAIFFRITRFSRPRAIPFG